MYKKIILLSICLCVFSSCKTPYDKTYSICYKSVRQKYAQPTSDEPIPNEAQIIVAYTISGKGELTAQVYNRTSEIMVIDQTRSFFVDTNGRSISYYDPTIRTSSTTNSSSGSQGASVNLGAIAGALGVGGIAGQIANGINVSGSNTSGQSVTNATFIADQPLVSLAPYGDAEMSKVFVISGLTESAYDPYERIYPLMSQQESPTHFSVCISYSLDEGKSFEKIVTEFYVDSHLNVPLKSEGKVNDALRVIEQTKPDMYNAPWWMLRFRNLRCDHNGIFEGIIYDYE